VVLAELRAAGYLESTIGQYARTIKVLARFAAGRGSDYSPELGAEFASMTVSPRTGRFGAQRRMDYGRLARVFDSYVRTGRVDLSVRTRGGGGPRPAADWLATFVRITAGILPEILAGDVYGSRLLDTYSELLRAAGTNLEGTDFCHLYLILKEQSLADAASFLLDAATLNPAAPEIIRQMKSHGLRRQARQLSQAVRPRT
jgi:hypothetical protein